MYERVYTPRDILCELVYVRSQSYKATESVPRITETYYTSHCD